MIIKGNAINHAAQLANYLQNDPKNLSANVIEIRGAAAQDLKGALLEWTHIAEAVPRCQLPLYSASVNPLAHEKLTYAQYIQAIDILERHLNLIGQPRAIVIQIDKATQREHAHIVWSRIEPERLRALPLSHNYRAHEAASREIEKALGLERVQGAHVEREGKKRPKRAHSQAELQQAARGLHPDEARAIVSEVAHASDNGQAFRAGMEEKGWLLARGNRGLVTLDPYGHIHSVARRAGMRAAEVRAKFGDLDLATLPSVEEAKQLQRQFQPTRPSRLQPAQTARMEQAPEPAPDLGRKAQKGRGEPDAARSIFRAAARILDGVANTFEALLGGGPSQPKPLEEIKRDRAVAEKQEKQKSALDAVQAQSLDDLTKRRQEFARELARHDKPEINHSLEEERKRERQRSR